MMKQDRQIPDMGTQNTGAQNTGTQNTGTQNTGMRSSGTAGYQNTFRNLADWDPRYDDMLEMPHHQSASRPHMSVHDRAAQFSPFAALTGHEAAIRETARLTEEFMELDEYEKAALDARLRELREKLSEQPEITLIWFRPDERKDGGAYVTESGRVKKIDDYGREIVFTDGRRILIERITEIRGEIFRETEVISGE